MTTDPGGGETPKTTFTLKQVMILMALFGVANAVTAWATRGGYAKGTEDQRRRWTNEVFLGVNLAVGFCLAYGVVVARLSPWAGIDWSTPAPQRTTPTPEEARKGRSKWSLSQILLRCWLYFLFISQNTKIILISLAIALSIVAWRCGRDPVVRALVRRKWKESREESIFAALCGLWGLVSFVTLVVWREDSMRWGFRLWFPIPPVVLIIVVGGTALAMATSRAALKARNKAATPPESGSKGGGTGEAAITG